MKVDGGREKLFSVDLKPLPTGPTPEQVAKRKGGMSSFGAKVNPVGGVTADFGIGYPGTSQARVTVGRASNVKPLGLDLGVEFQTCSTSPTSRCAAGCSSSTSARSRWRPRRIGGGIGVNGRSSYFIDLAT